MKATSVVREVMEKKHVSLSQLSKGIGKSMQVTWERLSQENISIARLNEMLDVVGYKVVIMPKDVEIKDGWYEAE